jgi:hypothetical protein
MTICTDTQCAWHLTRAVRRCLARSVAARLHSGSPAYQSLLTETVLPALKRIENVAHPYEVRARAR